METIEAGWAAFSAGDFAGAEELFATLLEDPAQAGEGHDLARFGLGYVWAHTDRFPQARSAYQTLVREAQARGDGGAAHRAQHQLGMVERLAGDWPAAQRCFEVERQMIEALGCPDLSVSVNAYELGIVALHLGESVQAKAWLDLCLMTARRTTDRVAVGCAHRALGDWHDAQGESRAATAHWRAAAAAFAEADDPQAIADLQGRLTRR